MITTEQEHLHRQEQDKHTILPAEKPSQFAQITKKITAPTAAELDQLINKFNLGLLAEVKEQAITLTQTFPEHGMAWKVLGVIYHNEQQIENANNTLHRAVALMPKDAEVHYNLANFHCDTQQFEAAKNAFQKAIKLAPDFAKAHFNLANVLRELKQFKSAETSYRTGLKLEPQQAKMHFHLGLTLHAQKRFKDALKSFRKSLELGMADVDLYLHLGSCYRALGDLEQAEQCCYKAQITDPQYAGTYNHLGIILSAQGRLQEAETAYLKAIELDADYVAVYKNLGLLYTDTGKVKEAEACCRKALSIETPSAETLNSMAAVLVNQGRYTEAETYCRQALALTTTISDVWNNLGSVLLAKMMLGEAREAFEKALAIQPNNVKVLSNYSEALRLSGKPSQAEAVLKKAIKLDSGHTNAYLNLGNAYLDQGLVENAIQTIEHALILAPEYLASYNNILFSTTYSETFSQESHLALAHEYGRIASQKADKKFDSWLVSSQDRCLRVGVVSGDLRQHPVAYFLKNVIQHIDAAKITLIAYLTDGRMDSTSLELKPYFAEWKSLAGHDYQAAAKIIHVDGVHILLDLSGHTAGNKLPIFSWQPAPVQASWLGYWSTTGVPQIDYCLADEISLPSTHKTQFSEKIKYLPDTRLCFSEPDTAAEVALLPAIKNGFITFGCYQNLAKVGNTVMQLWGEVMRAIPDAQLRWQSKSFADEVILEQVKQRLQKNGVDIKRVRLLGKASREAYFTSYAEVDMNLDSFPFTGGTTTCDALWMGVPTLTLAGNTMVARQGASLMTAAGLADWVACSQIEYIEKAISFCSDLAGLSALRSSLRTQLRTSTLFDGARFARNLETALHEIWQEKGALLAKAFIKNVQNETGNQNLKNVTIRVEIISATRMNQRDFWQHSALGQSLTRHLKQGEKLKINIAYENRLGLSEVFNTAIAKAEEDAVLVFVHDDVWLDEADISQAILAGLEQFDIIGVAGNKRRLPKQPSWAFVDTTFKWDTKNNLSGKVAHSKNAFGEISEYGDVPAECELLDGVFLAAKKQTLAAKQITFDPQFDFHFYDLDFCRTARKRGLSLGTWPIQLTHQSGGAFGTPAWQVKYLQYLEKWERLIDLDKIYQQAFELQEQGEIVEAARLYHLMLQHQPEHPEANHQLGFIEVHALSAETALPRFEAAVMAKPNVERFWVSYLDALMMAGNTEKAITTLETGQKFGLSPETAQLLATEYVAQLEAQPPKVKKTAKQSQDVLVTLIPAYKHLYIPQLLVSLATQTYPISQIIISDDSPNGEVSEAIANPALKHIVDKLNITLIQGPKQGTMSNLVHLLEYWQQSSQLVHILFDDDILYPTFYAQHVQAHAHSNVGATVSYRWLTSELGQPCAASQVPAFITDSTNQIDFLGAEQMFASVVPTCDNWLGEFSNTVFSSSIINLYKRSCMENIPYYGLGDIGLLLEISLHTRIAVIKNYLGGFRQNPQQNSANHQSIIFKCGVVAWVAIALASFKLGQISAQQYQQTVNKTLYVLNGRFQQSADVLEFIKLFSTHAAGSIEFEKGFLPLWQHMVSHRDWLHAQKIGQLA